ncbi:MAG: SRPBCC domain-containing protein [Blastocatellia bacterium]
MLVQLNQTLALGAPQNDVWRLLRDTLKFAALIPGLQEINALEAAPEENTSERYAARVTEKVGPFKLNLNLVISVIEISEPHFIRAELTGLDKGGQNRLKGTLSAALQNHTTNGTQLVFDSSVEVLGKMASLGAVPIRRRSNELFAEFARRVQQQFDTGLAGEII